MAALLDPANDAWIKHQRAKREANLRQSLPIRIAKTRARLAQLEAEARDLGIAA